jgi:superfamily II DNA or RNA helicase
MSGSPFKKDPVQRGFVQAYSGPLLAVVGNDEMIEKGISAKPNVMYLEPKMSAVGKFQYSRVDWRTALVDCDERNKMIAALGRAFVACGLQIVVFVTRTEHAKQIQQWIPEATLTHGSASNRKATEQKLRDGEVFCCIATAIFDTGFDTPHIEGLVYAGGGPDEIRLSQTLGRLLRQNSTGDKSPWFFDFFDSHHPVTKKHSSVRQRWFKKHHNINMTEDFALLPSGVYTKFVAELAGMEKAK